MSGDSVFIQAGNGQFLQALNGGGSTLNAGSNNQQAWETFKVVKQSGSCVINNGDIIGLQDTTIVPLAARWASICVPTRISWRKTPPFPGELGCGFG